MLEKFRQAKEGEIRALRKLAASGQLPDPWQYSRPDFLSALKNKNSEIPVAIIAEYKRASPSKGVICESVSVREAVRQYADAGADALSILTEKNFFQGDFSYLQKAAQATENRIPILRKDFIFDGLQIMETASTPASAVLLIARFLNDATSLKLLLEKAQALGLSGVVEIFDVNDLSLARKSGAKIIQVNARDLNTLRVDRKAALDLAARHPPKPDEVWIAASGICSPDHLREAANAGYSAVLVGTSLMASGEPGRALARLSGRESNEN